MRIDADPGISELGHVGPAYHDKTGTTQPRYRGSIGFCRRRILQRARPGAAHLPLDVEQILDRNGNAGIARWRGLHLAQPVHRFRRLDRRFRIDMKERPRALARAVGNPGKAFVDKLAGAGAAVFEIIRQ